MKSKTSFLSLIGFAYFGILIIFAIAYPWISKYTFDFQNIDIRLQQPSFNHLFGTDVLGRDLFVRAIYGARVSLTIGLTTALISFFLGTLYGGISGFIGGNIDLLMMRVVDIINIIPALLLSILCLLFLGSGLLSIVIALSIVSWVTQARLVRSQVLLIKTLPHVEAARAEGASFFRILGFHILPLLLGPTIVSLSIQIPQNILSESFLSFLGLGIQPPAASWGTLAAEGFRGMQSYPHLILFPGIMIFLTMLAFQIIGDWLRDYFSKRSGF